MTKGPGTAVRPDVPAWVRDAIFYQVFPDRFASSPRVAKPGPLEPWDAPPTVHGFKGGDLLGIAERLDELQDLGVTALYLTPVFSSASNHRYHTYDYCAVDPMLGGNAALRELVDALHARGMRIVLDGVFNHTGRGFWPFHHVVECGGRSPYVDWFHFDRERITGGPGVQPYPERVPADAARPAAKGMAATGYHAWWNLPALPKLNTDHPPVREYLFTVAEHWLRFGIDGWRLDVPMEIDDAEFWREFRRRCRAVNPEAYLLAEIWELEPEWVRGDRFDAHMGYPLQAAILAYTGGATLDMDLVRRRPHVAKQYQRTSAPEFAESLGRILEAWAPETAAAMLNLLSSHDMPRFVSMAGGDVSALRLATLLQMTLPGAPCIYYGDEVGLGGGPDPDCRRAFPAGAAGRDEALRACVRALAAARRSCAALRADRVRVAGAEGGALALVRGGADDASARGDAALVALNTAGAAATLRVPAAEFAGRRLAPLALPGFAPAEPLAIGADGAVSVTLAARSGAIWR